MNDIKIWKDLLDDLQDLSEENKIILNEIRQEVEMQKQRNKKEVHVKAQELQEQMLQLKELLEQLSQEDLYALEIDKKVVEQMQSTISAQIDKSQSLVQEASSMLSKQTFDQDSIDPAKIRTRKNREKNLSYHPKHFKESFLLGNWICYLTPSTFTCQSFWKDHTFKEYDFNQSKLMAEREGTFEVKGKTLILKSQNLEQKFEITGFNDDTIDYLHNGKEMSYQYMPEDLLNSFLDESQPVKNKTRKR